MHEFSIASGILENVIKEAEKHHAKKVTGITLQIGRLSMISPEQLCFALEILSEKTIAEGAKLDIETLPLEVKCESGHKSRIEPIGKSLYRMIMNVRCPACGKKADICGGRECIIKEINAE